MLLCSLWKRPYCFDRLLDHHHCVCAAGCSSEYASSSSFFFLTKTKMSFHEFFEFMSKWFTLRELCQDNPNVDSQQVTPFSFGLLNENNIDLQPLFFFLCTIYFFFSSVAGIRKGDLPTNHICFCSCCKECGSICSQVVLGRNLNLCQYLESPGNIHVYSLLCLMQFVPLGCEMSLFQIDVDTNFCALLSLSQQTMVFYYCYQVAGGKH